MLLESWGRAPVAVQLGLLLESCSCCCTAGSVPDAALQLLAMLLGPRGCAPAAVLLGMLLELCFCCWRCSWSCGVVLLLFCSWECSWVRGAVLQLLRFSWGDGAALCYSAAGDAPRRVLCCSDNGNVPRAVLLLLEPWGSACGDAAGAMGLCCCSAVGAVLFPSAPSLSLLPLADPEVI